MNFPINGKGTQKGWLFRKLKAQTMKTIFSGSGPHTMAAVARTVRLTHAHIRNPCIEKASRNAFLMFKLFLLNLFSYLHITLLPTRRHGPSFGLYRVWGQSDCWYSEFGNCEAIYVCSVACLFLQRKIISLSTHSAPTQTHGCANRKLLYILRKLFMLGQTRW